MQFLAGGNEEDMDFFVCVAVNSTVVQWNSKCCLIACSLVITAPSSQADEAGEMYFIPLLLKRSVLQKHGIVSSCSSLEWPVEKNHQ